jgi:AraC-like DNA-binding protein
MRSVVTVSNALVCSILDGIAISDAQRRQLLAEVGLVEQVVRDVNERTSIVRLARLWKRVLRTTGDDFVGLAIGSAVRGDRFGLGAHAAVHGQTFRQVLLRFAKFATLVNDLLECRLEETPPDARFIARLHWNVLGLERHAVDITFAGVQRYAREHVSAPFLVREIRLVHGLTAGASRYRALFGAPVVLGANRNELVFDAAALDEPVTASNPELGMILERYAAQELDRIPVVTDLPARVAQIVRQRLVARESVELATIAEQLASTPRSLQRHLRDRSTSLSTIIDDVRRALAPEWLAVDDANVEQVGFKLGYSEPTAFIRAFKKWYGTTPGNFRRSRSKITG